MGVTSELAGVAEAAAGAAVAAVAGPAGGIVAGLEGAALSGAERVAEIGIPAVVGEVQAALKALEGRVAAVEAHHPLVQKMMGILGKFFPNEF